MIKKIVSILIVVFLLAGCAQPGVNVPPDKTQEPNKTEEPPESSQPGRELYVVDILRPGTEERYTNESEIGKYIEEKFGIVFHYLPYSGDWAEKCALMLTSGEYPPVMQIDTAELVNSYIDTGALLSFDDYQDILPNFYEWFNEAIPGARAAAKDGKLYFYQSTGGLMGAYDTWCEWCIRSDLLEEQGWPSLLTASEWIEF